MRIKRQRFHNILKRDKTRKKNMEKYNAIDKAYGKLIFEKKKQYNHNRIDKFKRNLKKKWAVINELLGRKKRNKSFHSIYVDGILTNENKTIANGFNKFFSEIPKAYHDKLPDMDETKRLKECTDFLKNDRNSKYLPKKFVNSLFLKPTGPDEVSKIIAHFENKTSCGLDGISPKVVKLFPDSLIDCLVHIFNLSLSGGRFLSPFKKSKVIPIYKNKGEKSDMNNYRPISLLPVLSKVLERIMHSRLYTFLDKKDSFYSRQFGFRPKHSTDQAAALLVDKVSEALNNNLKVATVFLDMSKAFDCVDYNILLEKLYKCGIRGVAHN